MKPQSPKKVSISAHEVTCSQNVFLPIQNCPSNLTNNNYQESSLVKKTQIKLRISLNN